MIDDPDTSADDGLPDAYDDVTTIRHVCFTLVLVALADWLFYCQPVGWTLGTYGMLAGLATLLPGGTARPCGAPVLVLSACFFGACFRAAVDPGAPIVAAAACSWAALILAVRGGWTWSAARWCVRVWRFACDTLTAYAKVGLVAIVLPFAPFTLLFQSKRARPWLIPLALGLLFLGLFALANPVICLGLTAAWRAFLRFLGYAGGHLSFLRALFWVSLSSLLWTLLRHRPCETGLAATAATPHRDPTALVRRFLAPEVIRNALVVFNALFALQTILDFCYLWGGGVLPQGLTCAQYAHRGAYPLVATALLAAAFVLVTFRDGPPAPGLRPARRLVYAWLLQNLFLVVSAGWRLWLYVNVYSFTRLRLAAAAWMLLVACGLIWIIVRLFAGRTNAWLVRVNLVTALVVLLCYAWGLPSMFIASFNVRHCEEVGYPTANSIDFDYLDTLGLDALPALVWFERHTCSQEHANLAQARVDSLRLSLQKALRDWRGWTVKRAYLFNYLAREYHPLILPARLPLYATEMPGSTSCSPSAGRACPSPVIRPNSWPPCYRGRKRTSTMPDTPTGCSADQTGHSMIWSARARLTATGASNVTPQPNRDRP